MIKVILGGEVFSYDGEKQPVAEALAIEQAYGRRYVQWEQDLAEGGVKALCTLAWLIWRREGRDVDLDDILNDQVPEFDLAEFLTSLMKAGVEAAEEAAAAKAEPDPTIPGSSAPDGTPGTGTGTSASSRSGSGSGRGKSKGSPSGTSRR